MSYDIYGIYEFCAEFEVNISFRVSYAPPQSAHAERMWGIDRTEMYACYHA